MTKATARIATALAEINSADINLGAARNAYETARNGGLCASAWYCRVQEAEVRVDTAYAGLSLAIAQAPKLLRDAIAVGLEGADGEEMSSPAYDAARRF